MCDKVRDEAETASEASPSFDAVAAEHRYRNRGVQTIRSPFEFDVDHVFSYHPASDIDRAQYESIRAAAKSLALVIESNTPACADRINSLNQLRVCVMLANAAIALSGRLSR